MRSRVAVVNREDAVEVHGSQAQDLTALVTSGTVGAQNLPGGVVRMRPGGISRAHVHVRSEIVVALLLGDAATIVWEDGVARAVRHGVGTMCYIGPGVPHCAVNLSGTHPLVALEFRTDPLFNADVVLLPDLEDHCRAMAKALQADPVRSPRRSAENREANPLACSESTSATAAGSGSDATGGLATPWLQSGQSPTVAADDEF